MLFRYLIAGALSGIGATAIIDLWALFLRSAFQISSLNLCLLGRWVLHMPSGHFTHPSIVKAAPKPGECAAGWLTHYLIGVGLGATFALVVGPAWWARPTLWQPVTYGVVTVAMPLFLMQPALGLGVASSKTPNPTAARIKSLGTHTVFGLGLYATARALSLALPGLQGS
jgi:hypothetical protein